MAPTSGAPPVPLAPELALPSLLLAAPALPLLPLLVLRRPPSRLCEIDASGRANWLTPTDEHDDIGDAAALDDVCGVDGGVGGSAGSACKHSALDKKPRWAPPHPAIANKILN